MRGGQTNQGSNCNSAPTSYSVVSSLCFLLCEMGIIKLNLSNFIQFEVKNRTPAALEALITPLWPWSAQAPPSASANALQGLPEDSYHPVPSLSQDDPANI